MNGHSAVGTGFAGLFLWGGTLGGCWRWWVAGVDACRMLGFQLRPESGLRNETARRVFLRDTDFSFVVYSYHFIQQDGDNTERSVESLAGGTFTFTWSNETSQRIHNFQERIGSLADLRRKCMCLYRFCVSLCDGNRVLQRAIWVLQASELRWYSPFSWKKHFLWVWQLEQNKRLLFASCQCASHNTQLTAWSFHI